MQDNTEKPEDSTENEDSTPESEETGPTENSDLNEDPNPETEETVPPEDSISSKPETNFEEQEGEILPPEEKKKSGAGKVFLFLILVLAGSGSYLYFNNLIPPEILNFVLPKSAPSKPPALVTPTPPFMEEVAEAPEPVEVAKPPVSEPIETPQELEAHISGNEPKPKPHISGSEKEPAVIDEEETVNLEEPQPEETIEEEPQEEVTILEKSVPVIDEEVAEEVEPMAETVSAPAKPEVPKRSEASQAYLDFIESSVQKLSELVKEGFNWCWDYLKKKIA